MNLKVKEVVHSYNEIYPDGTDEVVRIKDIKIPQAFANTPPLEYKMARYSKLYRQLGHLDKPITVYAETNELKRKNILVLCDQYARYLVAKKFRLEYVPVKYISISDIQL